MRNLIKNKKKKGFTLIEMVAVVAIIGILAAILVPKITGYIREAKKTEVIQQARNIVQAYETYKMKNNMTASTTIEAQKLEDITDEGMLSLIGVDSTTDIDSIITKIPVDTFTVKDCINIVNEHGFTVNNDGELESVSASK